tara:strand:- start:213 stop:398 length:186 start_codon:yes stop_codon:yes gene_type:complete
MGTDVNGDEIEVGDIVKVAGSSNEYVVDDLHYGGDVADLGARDMGEEDIMGINTTHLLKIG